MSSGISAFTEKLSVMELIANGEKEGYTLVAIAELKRRLATWLAISPTVV